MIRDHEGSARRSSPTSGATSTWVALIALLAIGCRDERRQVESPSGYRAERHPDVELEGALRSVDDAHHRRPESIPTSEDAEESRAVLAHLLATHRRPLSATPLSVTWSARRAGTALSIYEVRDAGEQDEILDVLRAGSTRHGWKRVTVVFKEQPVTTSRAAADGALVTVRGPETVLREATIE